MSNRSSDQNGGGGAGPPDHAALTPAAASAPSRSDHKERDRNAAEFLKTARGGNGQTEQTDYVSKTPGDMKATAPSIIKKSHLNLIYDSKHPGQGRKNLLDTLAELGIDTGSFVAVFTLDKTQRNSYEADIQKVANAVRNGDIEVKSRGAETTLLQGRNPCDHFLAPVRTDGGLNGHFPLHTPGVNAGAGAPYSLRRPAAPYSLGRTGEVVLDDPHDPAVKRAWQQEQGIKADHDL
jgi:hypothetical protein